MSALPSEREPDPEVRDKEPDDEALDEEPVSAPEGETVVVRRNVALSVPVGAAASAVAIAYLWRAAGTGALLDWLLCLVMGAVAVVYLVGLVDSRTPLLVADEHGVRIRLGGQWRGLPWDAVAQVVVEPRKSALRDGRLLVVPHSLGRVLDGMDARARRQASLNQKLYGAALAVPLGLVTRISSAGEQDIADHVATLSQGRADVVTLVEQPMENPEDLPPAEPDLDDDPEEPPVRRTRGRHALPAGVGTLLSRLVRGSKDSVPEDLAEEDPPMAPAASAVPLRETKRGLRADVTVGATALEADDEETVRRLPEERQLRRPGSVDLVFEPVQLEDGPTGNVRPISQLGDAVSPLVIDDFETQPAYDPVIGPELLAARTRLGLSVDELADRTRIRPHVIESIEVDDFVPCGGDVYARGHIRTLARVLGKDAAPLVRTFDNRYANAPISARRVFEAELATGMTGSMRSTMGGPNWSLLAGFVLTLVLVWGVVRLFSGSPNEMVENPPPLPNGAHWPSRVYDLPKKAAAGAPTVLAKLVAVNGSTHVQVRGPDGKVLMDQTLMIGETKTLRVPKPFTVTADDGGALNVSVGRQDLGLLGLPDQPASQEFGAATD